MNLDIDVDYEQDSSSEDEEQEQDAADSDDFLAIGRYVITEVEEFLAQAAADELGNNNRRKRMLAGGTRPPYKRRSFDNQGAYQCILRDHLVGPERTGLCAKDFQVHFRMSRLSVESIIQVIGNSGVPFIETFRTNRFGLVGASIEAKVLLPLRVLAYGVAPHTFCDYFQMSVSQSGRCCRQFNSVIPKVQ